MKYLKSYKLFEKLGVSSYLFDLVKLAKENLEKNPIYVLKTNLKGNDITINFEFSKEEVEDSGLNLSAYFQVEDPDKLIFNIYLTDLKSSTILHELKHLDRALSTDLNTDSYFYLSHVGRAITLKYKHLLYNSDSDDILIQSLYLINPDEFESYYNQFYLDLKELITDDMDNTEKRKIIKEFLDNQVIYDLYKFFINRGGFDFENFFKDKKSLNEYLNILIIKIEQFSKHSEDYDIKKMDVVKSKLLSIANMFKKDDKDVNSIIKEINIPFNKVINTGYKKFHRLYTIFMD